MVATAENTGKARELLASGSVRVLFNDGWVCRAHVRDAAELITVALRAGRWGCSSCMHSDCSHVEAVRLCTRTV